MARASTAFLTLAFFSLALQMSCLAAAKRGLQVSSGQDIFLLMEEPMASGTDEVAAEPRGP